MSFFFVLGCSDKPKQHRESLETNGLENMEHELSEPYLNFSKGYESFNSEMISNAYTKDAILINVYNDSEPESYRGRRKINYFFSENLERAKTENINLKITFKISNREALKETILDNGFYKLEILDQSKKTIERYGKFSIVLKKEADDWKFFVDTNASSNKEEFQNAKSF